MRGSCRITQFVAGNRRGSRGGSKIAGRSGCGRNDHAFICGNGTRRDFCETDASGGFGGLGVIGSHTGGDNRLKRCAERTYVGFALNARHLVALDFKERGVVGVINFFYNQG